MHNPFTARNMIKDTERFFGRACEKEEIFTNLLGFQNTSVVGERRAGKSSLLWHISQPEVYKKYLGSEEIPYLFIFFDLLIVVSLNQKAFFKLLSEGLNWNLPEAFRLKSSGFDTYQEYFYELVSGAHRDFRIVICLDEFETVAANQQFDNAFLLYMRHFANLGKLAYVTSSREPLELICKGTNHLQGSDFWNIFVYPPLYLGPLKRDEAVQLVSTQAGGAGIPFNEAEMDYLFELAGYHPLFLQIASFYLFEIKKRKREAGEPEELSQLDLHTIAENFLMGATPHFEHIWDKLSPTEQDLLGKLDGAEPGGEFRENIRSLEKKGLLVNSDGKLRPFCRTFADFAREHHSPARIAVNADPTAATVPPVINAGMPLMENPPAPAVPLAPPSIQGKLEIWVGRNSEILINLTGPYSLSQFCPSRTKLEASTIKRFDGRVRNLPMASIWRLEKQEIGNDVLELFASTPEVSEVYIGARAALDYDDEQLLITFKCAPEMLAFPFEFINSFSSADEGTKHLALTHPIRKSLVGIRSKKSPLNSRFYTDPAVRVLLVSSNVSGSFKLNDKIYKLPPIPNVAKEISSLEQLFRAWKNEGKVQYTVDVRHDVTCEEMSRLIQHGNYDLIHFSGHGIYSDSPESSCLFFWKRPGGNIEGNTIDMLSANQLNALVNRTNIKFIYLSCCQGAMVGTAEHLFDNDFLGIAHSLLLGGVPSVLSMRWPLRDDTAVLLATTFYNELLTGEGFDKALLRARRHIQATMPSDYNWLSPVLVIQGD